MKHSMFMYSLSTSRVIIVEIYKLFRKQWNFIKFYVIILKLKTIIWYNGNITHICNRDYAIMLHVYHI